MQALELYVLEEEFVHRVGRSVVRERAADEVANDFGVEDGPCSEVRVSARAIGAVLPVGVERRGQAEKRGGLLASEPIVERGPGAGALNRDHDV
jgi:hypothetical protein